jgi:hypothetical protein
MILSCAWRRRRARAQPAQIAVASTAIVKRATVSARRRPSVSHVGLRAAAQARTPVAAAVAVAAVAMHCAHMPQVLPTGAGSQLRYRLRVTVKSDRRPVMRGKLVRVR